MVSLCGIFRAGATRAESETAAHAGGRRSRGRITVCPATAGSALLYGIISQPRQVYVRSAARTGNGSSALN